MSDESDQEVLSYQRRKRKRQPRIEDSDSSSDSSLERGMRRKKTRRVLSDSEASASDGDSSPILKPALKKRVPRIVSEEEGNSEEGSDWDDESSEGEGEGVNAENGSGEGEEEEDYDYEEEEGEDDSESGSDGQSEKCPICLRSFTTQEIGTPESCYHSFCVDCLQEWSKNVHTCPVDRQAFTLILVRRCLEGKVIRKIPIEPPRQHDEEEVLEDVTYCEVCGECDREDRMLLCDGCDLGYHLECLDPPMETVPIEEWFCPDCIQFNTSYFAEEVDIQDGELVDLIDDAYAANMPPLRPRVNQLLPRTVI